MSTPVDRFRRGLSQEFIDELNASARDDAEFRRQRNLNQGLRRRGPSQEFIDALNDDAQRRTAARLGEFRRGLRRGEANFGAAVDDAIGLGQILIGQQEAGEARLRRAIATRERANDVFAPSVTRVEDIGGIGDLGRFVAGQLGEQTINIASVIGSGGAGLATRSVLRGATGAAARALRNRAVSRRIAQEAGEALPRTVAPVVDEATAAAQRQAQRAALARGRRRAFTAGAFAGGATLQAGQTSEGVLEGPPEDRRRRAAFGALGALSTGALETLPTLGLLRRFGLRGPALRSVRNTVVGRVSEQAARQGASEATTEFLQTVGERATHQAVQNNFDTADFLSPEARSAYLNAAVAGFLVGGVFGAPAGLTTTPQARARIRAARERLRESVTERVQAGERIPPAPTDDAGSGSVTDEFKANLNRVRNSVAFADDADPETLTPLIRTGLFGAASLSETTARVEQALGADTPQARETATRLAVPLSLLPQNEQELVLRDGRAELEAASTALRNGMNALDETQTQAFAQFLSRIDNSAVRDALLGTASVNGGLSALARDDGTGNDVLAVDAQNDIASDESASSDEPDSDAEAETVSGTLSLEETTLQEQAERNAREQAPILSRSAIRSAELRRNATLSDAQQARREERALRVIEPGKNNATERLLSLPALMGAISRQGEEFNAGLRAVAREQGVTDPTAVQLSAVLFGLRANGMLIPDGALRPGLVVRREQGAPVLLTQPQIDQAQQLLTRRTQRQSRSPEAQARLAAQGAQRRQAEQQAAAIRREERLPPPTREEALAQVAALREGAEEVDIDRVIQGLLVPVRNARAQGTPMRNFKAERNAVARALEPLLKVERAARGRESRLEALLDIQDRLPSEVLADELDIINSLEEESFIRDDQSRAREVDRSFEANQRGPRRGTTTVTREGDTRPVSGTVRSINTSAAESAARADARREANAQTPVRREAQVPRQRRRNGGQVAPSDSTIEAQRRASGTPRARLSEAPTIDQPVDDSDTNEFVNLANRLIANAFKGKSKFASGIRKTIGTFDLDTVTATEFTKQIAALVNVATTLEARRASALLQGNAARARTRFNQQMAVSGAINALQMAVDGSSRVLVNSSGQRLSLDDFFNDELALARKNETAALRKAIAKERAALSKQQAEVDKATVDMVNALAKRFGVPAPRVQALEPGTTNVAQGWWGSYNVGTQTITIAPFLRGQARVETIVHEFGHHLIETQLRSAPKDIREQILADFREWRRTQRRRTVLGAQLSRAPYGIGQVLIEIERGRGRVGRAATVSQLRQENLAKAKELLSIHEYIADQISRALTSNRGFISKQGPVQRFFSAVAEQLRKLYNALIDPKNRADEGVRRWVNYMLQHPEYAVTQAPTARPAIVRNAKDLGGDVGQRTIPNNAPTANASAQSTLSYTMMLSPADRNTLFTFFTSRGIFDQLVEAAPAAMREKMLNYETQLEAVVDFGTALAISGRLNVDATTRSVLAKFTQFLRAIFGIPNNRALAEQILHDVQRATPNLSSTNAAQRIVADRSQPVISRALLAANTALKNSVGRIYDRTLRGLDDLMANSGVPALIELQARFSPRSGQQTSNEGLIRAVNRATSQWSNRVVDAIEGLSAEDQTTVLTALQSQTVDALPAALQARANALKNTLRAFGEYMVSKGVDMQLREDFNVPIVIDGQQVEQREAEFKALLTPFVKQMRAEIVRMNRERALINKPAIKIETDEDVVDFFYRMATFEPDVSAHDVSFSSGAVVPGFSARRRRVSAFILRFGTPEQRNQFASFQSKDMSVVLGSYIREGVRRAEFTARFPIRKVDGVKTNDIAELLKRAREQGATPEQLSRAQLYVDTALGINPTDINEGLLKIFSFVDSLLGTKLSKISPRSFQKFQNNIVAYQNWRLLPLAALSSLIDPLGSFVRNNGDLRAHLRSMRATFRDLRKRDPAGLVAAAESLGIIERIAVQETLAFVNGGAIHLNTLSQKANNLLFKVNGLEAITKFSRIVALGNAHQFLLRHAERPNANSERFLTELGVSAADIKRDPNNPDFVILNPKTEAALFRFVDESVIRPNPLARPAWMNDPNFALVAQYKGFLFSFYETVVKRIVDETRRGNPMVLMPAALYIPVQMMAEIMRDTIQGDADDDDDDDMTKYFYRGVERSGLLGPRAILLHEFNTDIRYGAPGNSFAGPTFQQINRLQNDLFERGDFGSAITRSLPGATIFSHRTISWLNSSDSTLP